MEVENPGARETAVSLLLPLFFLSGATALTYQTLWVRHLELVFGTSTFAISTVLSSFMLGLALGGFLCARYVDRLLRPLFWYGALEIGIGIYALLFPLLVKAITPVYLAFWRMFEPGPLLYGLIQFLLIGALLILPTAMMGATLPLLARFATDRLGAAGDRVGTLYAVNTAGAVFGTWLCGFVLLPGIGRFATVVVAALANLALGTAAVMLDRWARSQSLAAQSGSGLASEEGSSEEKPVPATMPMILWVSTIAVGIAGFSALVYEVAWTRLLALMLGASTYTFSVMLLAFLTGIALGGKLGGPLADQLLARFGLRGVLLAFAGIEVGIAVVSYLLMYLYPELPFWYVWVFDAFKGSEHPTAVWAVSLLIAGLIMTPPAILMGMHFPVAVRAVLSSPDALGAPVGRIYGANTLGGVLGAFLAGFVLLPRVQVQGTIFVAGAAELLAAAVLVLYAERAQQGSARWRLFIPLGAIGLLMVVVAQRPPWDKMLMTAGMYHYVSHFSNHSREGILDYSVSQYDLVFYEEGLSSVVTVARNKDSGNMWLANNGKVDASTTTDMPTQVLCSLLPMQFVEKPDDVLIIGLASGVTAGAVSLIPEVKNLEVVELEPAIHRAARYFAEHNHNLLEDPRLKLIFNDGRNHVLLAPEQSYDVIVSEPPNPWISGVANLFTLEFFEIGKTRLKPGGVWSQWVQMYGMDSRDLQTLLKTFAQVYPYVLVYATIEDADLVLIGSDKPLSPGPDKAARLFRWPRVREELKVVPIDGPMNIVSIFQLDRDAIMRLAGDAPLNTDDSMIIEYSAPLNLHVDTSEANFELLLKYNVLPKDALPPDVDIWVWLARTYREREDYARAVEAMAQAVSLLPEGDARKETFVAEVQQWKAELEAEAMAEEEG